MERARDCDRERLCPRPPAQRHCAQKRPPESTPHDGEYTSPGSAPRGNS
jgi:hypothetical protein